MDLSRKVTFNTLTQILGRTGVIFLSLLATSILTRNLGQAGYGVFGIINTMVVIFYSFADWGTNMIAVRESAKSPEKSGVIFGNCLFLRSLMAFFGMTLYWLFIFLNPHLTEFRREASIGAVIILFFSFKTSAQIIFHAKLKLYLTALVELLASGLFLIFLLTLKKLILFQVILFLIISSALAALLAVLMALKMVRSQFRPDWPLIKHLVRESLPMGAVMVVFSIYNRVDTFILQSLKGEAVTGLYLLSYKIYDNLVLGAAYLMNAFFPILANFSGQVSQEGQLKNVLQKAFDLLLAMAVFLLVVIFIFAPMIIDWLGGEEFAPSASSLRILVLAMVLAYLNHLTGYALVALGRQRVHLKFGLIALFANIILNFIFIPRFSFLGAAVVTVLTEGLIFILTFVFLSKALKIPLGFLSFPKTVRQLISQRGKVF